MAKSKLSMILPRIGTKLDMLMTVNNPNQTYTIEPCIVTYVNEEHGYYEVEYLGTNLKESYKLPIFNYHILEGKHTNTTPVICVETGFAYSTISDCSKDLGIHISSIASQLNGKCAHASGYHFIKLI